MKTCDACDEEWEDDFFCDKCTGLEMVEVTVPNIMWDGLADDELIDDVEWVHQDICLNCCSCHYGVVASTSS